MFLPGWCKVFLLCSVESVGREREIPAKPRWGQGLWGMATGVGGWPAGCYLQGSRTRTFLETRLWGTGKLAAPENRPETRNQAYEVRQSAGKSRTKRPNERENCPVAGQRSYENESCYSARSEPSQ